MLVNDLSRWRKKPQREGGNVASRPDFESIKHLNPYKVEYWEASKPMPLLRYKTWHEFEGAIERAKISCEAMGNIVEDHFVAGYKMVKRGSGAERQVSDYSLTYLACYLIAMNGNPRLKQIAEAQHYFAVSTRKNEMHELRLQVRLEVVEGNKQLSEAGVEIGVRSHMCKFAHFVGENVHIPWADAPLYCHVKEAEPPTK